MATTASSVQQLTVNTIRTLSMDAVQKAASGHPGTPMALAPVVYSLWNDVLKFDPADPTWPVRDRFVLSCGHASMLLYSLLHLAGVKQVDQAGQVTDEPAVSLEQIRQFRQLGSRCPGHPEYGETGGVETTTGPLGQGAATSVGMAIAAEWKRAHFSRPGHDIFGSNVYALCSDGDLMEGICCEAASLAGHLKLSNLCWIYDDNRITIEGGTDLAFSENVAERFTALGWNVARIDDANDVAALTEAYRAFEACNDGPTLIIVRSQIGYGSPNKAGTAGAHGSPLGQDEVALTKAAYGWAEEDFLVPEGVCEHFAAGIGQRGAAARKEWQEQFAAYSEQHPELAEQWDTLNRGELPNDWDAEIPAFEPDAKGLATRVSSGQVLTGIAKRVPWLVGGSADLAPSTMTLMKFEEASEFSAENRAGCNFHFGIREHAMAAAVSGMTLGGLRAFGATFFVFTDYMRPSMRLAAMMGLPTLYILTHDSIGLGEDGPTHQPVEHLAACRAIPNLVVMRPADANEVLEAYRVAMTTTNRPMAFVLTRQGLPTLDRSKYGAASGVARGAYVLADCDGGTPQVILIGTGSEVPICLTAHEQLTAEGIKSRVVSMPSWELFDDQDEAYRDSVLPPNVTARVAVEAGIQQGWEKYIGRRGRFVGMSSFGASAPIKALYEHFGITPDAVVAAAKAVTGFV